jgi:hypothetical protein
MGASKGKKRKLATTMEGFEDERRNEPRIQIQLNQVGFTMYCPLLPCGGLCNCRGLQSKIRIYLCTLDEGRNIKQSAVINHFELGDESGERHPQSKLFNHSIFIGNETSSLALYQEYKEE